METMLINWMVSEKHIFNIKYATYWFLIYSNYCLNLYLKLNRPVGVILDITFSCEIVGKREDEVWPFKTLNS